MSALKQLLAFPLYGWRTSPYRLRNSQLLKS